MRSYSSISFKYMWQHKMRTILNILSIVISVAMISMLGNLAMGIRDLILFDTMSQEGYNQAIFSDIDYSKYQKLKLNVDVEDVVISKPVPVPIGIYDELEKDFVSIPENNSSITSMGEGMEKIAPDLLIEGRYPSNSKEIVMRIDLIQSLNFQLEIGSTITMHYTNEASERYEEYTLVGIMKSSHDNNSYRLTSMITGIDPGDTGGTFNAYIFTSKRASNSGDILKIAERTGILYEQVFLGSMYSDALGVDRINLIVGVGGAFFMLIIAITTFSGIFTVFNISYAQRLKQFGLMRAVGATEKQINDVNKREIIILALISIPLGLLLGRFIFYLMFNWISGDIFKIFGYSDFKLKFYPELMIVIAVLSFATIYFSVYAATIRKRNLSPIEAIRQSDLAGVKVRKKRYFFTKLILGMEGYLARRNIDRSKGKFLLSTLSIAVTITIFVSSIFVTKMVSKMNFYQTDSKYNYDIYYRNNTEDIFDRKIINELQGAGAVETIPYYNIAVSVDVRMDYLTNELANRLSISHVQDDLYTIFGSKLLIMDGDDILNSYDVIPEVLDEVIKNKSAFTYTEFENHIENFNYYSENEVGIGVSPELYFRIPVGDYPIKSYVENTSYPGGITIIIPTEVAKNYISTDFLRNYTTNIGVNIDPKQSNIIEEYIENNPNISARFNLTERLKRENQIKAVRAYLLIFSGMIALVSGINIINSIGANMLTRRKELSLLKAVGMSKKAFRRMMTIETIYYSIWGSILGFIFSYGGILLAHRLIFNQYENPLYFLKNTYPIISYIVIVIATVFIVYLSSIVAMSRVIGNDLIANLRNE